MEDNPILAKSALLESFDIADGNRRSVINGGICELQDLLSNTSVVFVGAPRTLRFTDLLSIPRDQVIIIPDSAAIERYTVIRQEVEAALDRVARRSPESRLVLAHSAASFGLSLLLDIGCRRSLVSLDLGLAAAIFDTEYMASRPWFRENVDGILSTRRQLEARAAIAQSECQHVNSQAASEFGAHWIWATAHYEQDPLGAIERLDYAVKLLPRTEAPIANATLEYWRYLKGHDSDHEGLLSLCQQTDKHEPDIFTAVLLWAKRCSSEQALSCLESARRKSPFDPVAPQLHEALTQSVTADRLESVRQLLRLERRPFDGGRLNWSLWGDFPRSMDHNPLESATHSATNAGSHLQ